MDLYCRRLRNHLCHRFPSNPPLSPPPSPLQAVLVEGVPVETWLLRVETMMRDSLKKLLVNTFASLKATKKDGLDKWVHESKGQMQITSAQINWTGEVERVLIELGKGVLLSLVPGSPQHPPLCLVAPKVKSSSPS